MGDNTQVLGLWGEIDLLVGACSSWGCRGGRRGRLHLPGLCLLPQSPPPAPLWALVLSRYQRHLLNKGAPGKSPPDPGCLWQSGGRAAEIGFPGSLFDREEARSREGKGGVWSQQAGAACGLLLPELTSGGLDLGEPVPLPLVLGHVPPNRGGRAGPWPGLNRGEE